MIETFIGDTYVKNGIAVMVVGESDDIIIVGIMTLIDGCQIQCPFAPVSQIVFSDFVRNAKKIPAGNPSSISGSLKQWREANNGHESFFEIPIEEIWALLINSQDLTQEKLSGPYFLLPNAFPAMSGGHDGEFIAMKCGSIKKNTSLN